MICECKQADIDPNRPLSEQKYCLYARSTGKLLGRHPTKAAAQKQEAAIQIQKHAMLNDKGRQVVKDMLKQHGLRFQGLENGDLLKFGTKPGEDPTRFFNALNSQGLQYETQDHNDTTWVVKVWPPNTKKLDKARSKQQAQQPAGYSSSGLRLPVVAMSKTASERARKRGYVLNEVGALALDLHDAGFRKEAAELLAAHAPDWHKFEQLTSQTIAHLNLGNNPSMRSLQEMIGGRIADALRHVGLLEQFAQMAPSEMEHHLHQVFTHHLNDIVDTRAVAKSILNRGD